MTPVQEGACTQLVSSPLVFAQCVVLWVGQAAGQSHFWESSLSLSLFFFFLVFSSLAIPQFELLSLLSSLRLSSRHSGLVLTLSTDYADHTSLSSPYMLVADTSFWVTSPLAVTVRHI